MAGMTEVKATLVGSTPLLLHNSQLANPLNPTKQAIDEKMAEKRKKKTDTLRILTEIARLEFEGGLYCESKVGPYLPNHALMACLTAGARLAKKGREMGRAVQIPEFRNPLQYDGPRLPHELWEKPAFRHQAMVRVGTGLVLRTRPKFDEWSCSVNFLVDEGRVTRKELVGYLEDAGLYEGIGDARSMGYGRFEVRAA